MVKDQDELLANGGDIHSAEKLNRLTIMITLVTVIFLTTGKLAPIVQVATFLASRNTRLWFCL